MSDITYRVGLGRELTWDEVDDNFRNLNEDKYQAGDSMTASALTVGAISYPSVDGTANQIISTDGAGNLNFVTFSVSWDDVSSKPTTFTPSAHTHAATDVTSGVFADARISETSVTQHEAALTITESQISDLGAYLTTVSWGEVTGKPTTFTPSAHTHVKVDITDFNDADYATAAQGARADSATQPGDDANSLGSGSATNGFVLTADGSGNSAWEKSVGGIEWSTKTANYTMAANEGVVADTSSGVFTVTLPATPSAGDALVIADGDDWATNNLTVARNGSTIEGLAEDMVFDVGGLSVEFVYDGTTWKIYPRSGVDPDPSTLDGVTIGSVDPQPGTFTTFTSTGIDDNATSTAITIDSNGSLALQGAAADVSSLSTQLQIKDVAGFWGFKGIDNFQTRIFNNVEYDGTNFKYIEDGPATSFGCFGVTSSPYFQWAIAASGTAGNNATLYPKMTLDSSGNLYVGRAFDDANASGLSFLSDGFLRVNRASDAVAAFNRTGSDGQVILVRNDGAAVGSIDVSGSSTSYNTSSDVRLKENITDADSFDITALKVRQFDWKADGKHQPYGFIAQELYEVFPDAVSVGGDDEKTEPWAVDNSKLVPVLVKAIQELIARVEELEAKQ